MIGRLQINIQYKPDEMADVVVTCIFCGVEQKKFEVAQKDWNNYCGGMFAQDAFPYLTDPERELLISAVCPTCWDELL